MTTPVQHQYIATVVHDGMDTSTVAKQNRCRTAAAPVLYQCRTTPVQDQSSASNEWRRRHSVSAVPAHCKYSNSTSAKPSPVKCKSQCQCPSQLIRLQRVALGCLGGWGCPWVARLGCPGNLGNPGIAGNSSNRAAFARRACAQASGRKCCRSSATRSGPPPHAASRAPSYAERRALVPRRSRHTHRALPARRYSTDIIRTLEGR